MKRAMEAAASARADVYWRIEDPRSELERSGIEAKLKSVKRNPRRESSLRDPRSEFHTSMSFKKVMKFSAQIMHS